MKGTSGPIGVEKTAPMAVPPPESEVGVFRAALRGHADQGWMDPGLVVLCMDLGDLGLAHGFYGVFEQEVSPETPVETQRRPGLERPRGGGLHPGLSPPKALRVVWA